MISWLSIFNLKNPNPQAAFRAACSITVAALFGFYLNLPIPYWAAVSAAAVSLNYYQASFNKALHRIIGTVIGGILGALLSFIVGHNAVVFLLTSTLIISSSFYISQLSRFPYLFLMCGITTVLTLALNYTTPGNPWLIAYNRAFEITLGVLSALVCSRFIFYNDATKEFKSNLQSFYETLNAIIHTDNLIEILSYRKKLHQLITKDQKLIDLFYTDIEVLNLTNQQANYIFQTQQNLSNALDYFFHRGIDLDAPKNAVSEQIKEDLASLLSALTQHDFEKFIILYNQKSASFLKLQKQLTGFFEELYEIIYIHLSNIQRVLTSQSFCLPESKPWYKQTHATEIAYQYFLISIKTGLSFLIAGIFWFKFGGSAAIQGLITAMVIAPQKNLFDQANVAKQRVYGTLIGAMLGVAIIQLLPYKIWLISFAIFIVGWLFSYLYLFGKANWKNVGLQANVAFIIAAVHNHDFSTNTLVFQRLWGVTIGIAVILVITWLVWPQYPRTLLKVQMQKISEDYQAILQFLGPTKAHHNEVKDIFSTINWRFTICENLLESIANLQGYHNARYYLFRALYHRLHEIESSLYVAWLLMEEQAPLAFSTTKLDKLHEQLRHFNQSIGVTRISRKATTTHLNAIKDTLRQAMGLLQ